MMNPLVKAAIDLLIVLPIPKSQIEMQTLPKSPQQCNQFLHQPDKHKDVAFWMHLVPNRVAIKHGSLEHPHPPFMISPAINLDVFRGSSSHVFFRRVSAG
jgi:hypothetical protein